MMNPSRWRCAVKYREWETNRRPPEYFKEYYEQHRDRRLERGRIYREDNGEQIRARARNRWAALSWEERYAKRRRKYIVLDRPRMLLAQRERVLEQLRQLEEGT